MIKTKLAQVMLERGVTSTELASAIGITPANLSILKTGKAHGVRFNTLDKICAYLNCQPGDIFMFEADELDKFK